MNTALAILAHALRMLMFQTSTTLRVLMPAMLLVLGCSIAITVFAPDMLALLQQPPAQMTTASPRSALAFVVIGVVGLMGYALMAIMWHRHVLLNGPERDARRTPSPGIFLAYLGRAIAVGCLQFIAALPVYLLMGGLLASVSPDATNSMMETVLSLLVSWLLIWIALRFSVVLPAAALGRRMTVDQAGRARIVGRGPAADGPQPSDLRSGPHRPARHRCPDPGSEHRPVHPRRSSLCVGPDHSLRSPL